MLNSWLALLCVDVHQSGQSVPYPGPNSETLLRSAAFTALIFSSSSVRVQAWRRRGTNQMLKFARQQTERCWQENRKSADLSGGRFGPLVEVTLQGKQTLKLVDLCNFWAESKLTDLESLVVNTKKTRHSMWFMRNPFLPWDIFSLLDILTIEGVKSWVYYSANVLGYSGKREVLLLLAICFKLASASLRL